MGEAARLGRTRSVAADDDVPRLHAPARDESLLHVGVALREALCGVRAVALEDERRAADRLAEGARHHQLTALLRLPRLREMAVAERCAALEIVLHDVVEQQVVHPSTFLIASDLDRCRALDLCLI